MAFCRQDYWSGLPSLSPRDLPHPGIKPRSPALQVDSLLSEAPGKLKNTGEGNLSLLQGIFPTQESNWSLLNCRQILYQLSYQGSPTIWHMNALVFQLPYNENVPKPSHSAPLVAPALSGEMNM